MSGFRQFEKCDVFPCSILRRGKGEGLKNLFGYGVGINTVEIIIELEYIMVCSKSIGLVFIKFLGYLWVFVSR